MGVGSAGQSGANVGAYIDAGFSDLVQVSVRHFEYTAIVEFNSQKC
jgi:hypothetical protein